MMMSKPVVATDIRGSREEVVPEETGLLVPVRSPHQLAAAVETLLLNPSLGKSLGKAGRERALRFYDEKRVVATQIQRINMEIASLCASQDALQG